MLQIWPFFFGGVQEQAYKMPNLNINSITHISHGVQSRTITLTGNKRNPASFCACYTYTRARTCTPEPFYKSEPFIRVTLRVAVLPPNKEGYRRPIYKHLKWRPRCLTTLLELSNELNCNKWVVDQARKLKERQERGIQRRREKEANRKPEGRPRLNLNPDQRRIRRGLQRKLSVYKLRAAAALAKDNFELYQSRTETIERLKLMIEAQTTTEIFKHDPMFDPNKEEQDGL